MSTSVIVYGNKLHMYLCLGFYFFSEATQTSEKGIAIENEQNESKD